MTGPATPGTPAAPVVPAALATDDRVRVKFENQDDPAVYDPSIADVWAYRPK